VPEVVVSDALAVTLDVELSAYSVVVANAPNLTLEIARTDALGLVIDAGGVSLSVEQPSSITLELKSSSPSLTVHEIRRDTVTLALASVGIRGPAGSSGSGATFCIIASNDFDGTATVFADLLAEAPDEGKPMFALMSGVGAVRVVDGEPVRAQVAVSGINRRGLAFGYAPDAGDFGALFYTPLA
jgi:hypothetical protein